MQRHNLLQNAIVYDTQPAEEGLFNQMLGKRSFEEELQLNSAAASILKATPPAQDASVTLSSVPYTSLPTKHLIGNTFPIVCFWPRMHANTAELFFWRGLKGQSGGESLFTRRLCAISSDSLRLCEDCCNGVSTAY